MIGNHGFVVGASHLDGERQKMQEPEDIRVMMRLQGLGWGTRRIAAELGVSRTTVQRYLHLGGYAPYGGTSGRAKVLDGEAGWLAERLRRHAGNADVVRQELAAERGIGVSLRTVERAVKPERQRLEAEGRATVRFETAPGKQLQGDFGTMKVEVGGETVQLHACVLTLGYSRRIYVEVFDNQRLESWLSAFEAAFGHFGGVPEEMLLDNAKALVSLHNVQTHEVVFSTSFSAFARYWGFVPRACAPYRARTKGKDERAVGYVKRNAIAGRRFASLAELRGHLGQWMREVADVRIHGTTGERPIDRFARAEASALIPIAGRPPFLQKRELTRTVHADLCVAVDSNYYSVPWRYIGESVLVTVSEAELVVFHAGQEIARHPTLGGINERSVLPEHFAGVRLTGSRTPKEAQRPAELLRPLADYEAAVGGGW